MCTVGIGTFLVAVVVGLGIDKHNILETVSLPVGRHVVIAHARHHGMVLL